eukprot:2450209-Pleurochrysis_carterae.AAC.1
MVTHTAVPVVLTPAHHPPGRHYSAVWGWGNLGWRAVGRYGAPAPRMGCCGELWGSQLATKLCPSERELNSPSLTVAGT